MDNYSYQLYSNILKLFWRIFLILLTIVAVVIVFPYVKSILLMFIISWLLATLLAPLIDFFERHGIARGFGMLIVMLLVLTMIAIFFSIVIPALIKAVESISSKLQSDMITDLNQRVALFFEEKFNNAELANNITTKLNEIFIKLLSGVAAFFKNVTSFLASIVIVPFITFFLIKDNRVFKKLFISKIPNKYFELVLNILDKVGSQVSNYIQGQAMDALLVGILSVSGLFVVNLVFDNPVPYFVFIGMLAGLANLIPYLGPVVGAVPALILAIISAPPNLFIILIWIVVVFALVQILDNSLISPMVVSKSVDMHPLLVVVVVIIGGNIGGAMGMLFAVPATSIIKVTLSEVIWGLTHYKLN